MTHYDWLQVSPDASPEVIEAAYKTLIKRAHPDAGGSIDTTLALNLAREVLLDPDLRRQYDAKLAWEATLKRSSAGDHNEAAPRQMEGWNSTVIFYWVHHKMGFLIVGFAALVLLIFGSHSPAHVATPGAFATTAIACLVVGVFCAVAVLFGAFSLSLVLYPFSRFVSKG